MVVSGLQPDLLSYSIAMNAMCDSGDVDGARQILASMLASGVAPDMRVYSTLAKGGASYWLRGDNGRIRDLETGIGRAVWVGDEARIWLRKGCSASDWLRGVANQGFEHKRRHVTRSTRTTSLHMIDSPCHLSG